MDIKLKDKYLNIVLFILAIYMFAFSIFVAYDLLVNNEYMKKDAYFQSYEFKREINSFCDNIYNVYITYDYCNKPNKEEKGEAIADKRDVDGLKLFYENKLKDKQIEIEKQYLKFIQEAEKSNDKDKVIKLNEERNKKLDEVRIENTKSDKELRAEVASRFYKDYEKLIKSLQNRKDIGYYVKNIKTKEVYSNLNKVDDINEYIKNKSMYTIVVPLQHIQDTELKGGSNRFRSSSLEGYIIIPKNLDSNDYILKNYKYFEVVKDRLIKEAIIGGICLIVSLFILMCIVKHENIKLMFLQKAKSFYDNIPLDLKIFMFSIYTIIMFLYLLNLNFFYKPFNINHFIKLTIMSIYISYSILNIKFAIKLARNKKEISMQLKAAIINKLLNGFKKNIVNKSVKFKIITVVILTIIIGFMIMISMFIINDVKIGLWILTISISIYLFVILRYLFKKANQLEEILKGTEALALGNLDYIIKGIGEGALGKIANNINNLKLGYKKSVEEKVKSERLKSELITNVSHDLKTPLTSIINYVNLLKNEDLSKGDMEAYISVLDRKSERLKVLIEDLFEASKMSSGSVEVNIEKVDVTALLKQAIAEFDEKLKNLSLELRFNHSNNKIYANLDGKKTWRVFENLINNIIKYSQPNTRVYIDLIEEKNKVKIIMKNIASYEMDFKEDEIFERFKRGDKSRATEGSGLGLAISKSIVEIQEGKLNIVIDGDLFKAIVEFNK